MKNIFNIKTFCLITLIVCILSLITAIYIEHIIEIKPCKLCIYQRFPYLVAIFISFLGYYFPNNIFWVKLLTLIFVISFVISGYHVGIENEFFKEFSGCTNKNINLLDKSEILNSLQNEVISCKNVNFKILGMSLATINMIISSLFVIIYLKIINNEKNK
jgi:disulfide bond formation protein DsbB